MPFAPCLSVSSTEASIAFYEKLGFNIDSSISSPDEDIHMLLYDGEFCGMIYSNEDLKNWLPCLKNQAIGFAGMFYLPIDHFEERYKQISKVAEVVKPITTDHNGQTMFYIIDIDGYVIGFTDKNAFRSSDLGKKHGKEHGKEHA